MGRNTVRVHMSSAMEMCTKVDGLKIRDRVKVSTNGEEDNPMTGNGETQK